MQFFLHRKIGSYKLPVNTKKKKEECI